MEAHSAGLPVRRAEDRDGINAALPETSLAYRQDPFPPITTHPSEPRARTAASKARHRAAIG